MEIEVRKPQAAQTPADGGRRTRARSIIEKLRAQSGNLIEKREVGGEPIYIKRLNFPEITRVRMAVPFGETGSINLSNQDHLRGVIISTIAAAVVVGVSEPEESADIESEAQAEGGAEAKLLDATPFYSIAEAIELVDEPGALAYVAELFNTITSVNPHLLPNSKAAN